MNAPQKQVNISDEQAAAAISFFNTDQLIKFASGAGAPCESTSSSSSLSSSSSSADKNDFGLSALNDDALTRTFEFKLNDEIIKDFPLNASSDKS